MFPHFFTGQSIAPILIGLTAPYALSTNALILLSSGVVSGLTNLLYLLPASRSVKEQRFALEDAGLTDSEEHKALTKQFGKLHGFSLLFNLVNFASLTGYGFIIVRNLVRYVPK